MIFSSNFKKYIKFLILISYFILFQNKQHIQAAEDNAILKPLPNWQELEKEEHPVIIKPIDGTEPISPALMQLLEEMQTLNIKEDYENHIFATKMDKRFLPEARMKFKLPYYLLPSELADSFFTKSLSPEMRKQLETKRNGKIFYKLLIHPLSEKYFNYLRLFCEYVNAEDTEFQATSLDSIRTLLAWNNKGAYYKPFMPKTSLDTVIANFNRLIKKEDIQISMANQQFFETIQENEDLRNLGIDILPETMGVIPKPNIIPGGPKDPGGLIIKEIPDFIINGEKRWFSFATLLSDNNGKAPIIMKIIKQSQLSSFDFIEKYLINTYLKTIEELLFKRHLSDLPHSQNLTFETDKNLNPTGIFPAKDFGGRWPDPILFVQDSLPLALYAGIPGERFVTAREEVIKTVLITYFNHVFLRALDKIAKYDKKLKSKQIKKLRNNLIEKHLALIKKYFNLNPTKMLIYKLHHSSLAKSIYPRYISFSEPINSTSINLSDTLASFINKVYKERRIIAYTNLGQDSRQEILDYSNTFFITPELLYVVTNNNNCIANIILTEEDLKELIEIEPNIKTLLTQRTRSAPACTEVFKNLDN